jgi:hypothetical protein
VGSARPGEVRPLAPSTGNASAESQDAVLPTAEQPVPDQPAAEPALALVGAAPGRTGLRRGETASLAA